MLIGIHNEILNAREDVVHYHRLLDSFVKVLAKIANLVGSGSSDLSLAIFQQTLKKRSQN
jgi:hypothetical protein